MRSLKCIFNHAPKSLRTKNTTPRAQPARGLATRMVRRARSSLPVNGDHGIGDVRAEEVQTHAASSRQHQDGSEDSDDAEVLLDQTQTQTNGKGTAIPDADMQLMVRNFVRLALAMEYTRTPIKREEISKRVFVNDHKRCFAAVFDRTQARLRSTLGMELVELPAKDKTRGMTVTQQRKAAHTQATTGSHIISKPSKSWILRTLLPYDLKHIAQRQHQEQERNYNAVVTIICIIVAMSDDQCCLEGRVQSSLERLGWYPSTPAGLFEEVIARMTKQNYIDRIKDDQSMEGSFSLAIGPRGKLETLGNRDELLDLVAAIYTTGRRDGNGDSDGRSGPDSGAGDSRSSADVKDRLKRLINDTLDIDDDDNLRDHEDEVEHDDLTSQMPPPPQLNGSSTNGHNGHSSRSDSGRPRKRVR